MATIKFSWTEEYCKAVQHYLATAQRSANGKSLKKGELERIATTLGIDKSVLKNGIHTPDTLLHIFLQTGIFNPVQFTQKEVEILIDFVLHNSDNLQHAFRSTVLYYRANGMRDRSVRTIEVYYYTRLKPVKEPEDLLFNIESLTNIFGGNVKNNISKGASTRGVI